MVATKSSQPTKNRRIVFVVFDQLQLLDLTGPLDVFSTAARLFSYAPYETIVASKSGGLIRSSAGLAIDTRTLSSIRGPIDTTIVVGGIGSRSAMFEDSLLKSIQRLASKSKRVTSVCSGAFLLAEAGLLHGRRATTHWQWCDVLADRYPDITVEPDAIYVSDGPVWTSAGVTAGIDLALALVGEDHDPQTANDVARQLVVPRRRSGGQSQFLGKSAADLAFGPESAHADLSVRKALGGLLEWITEHLSSDLSVNVLAQRTAMSERNFARVFQREMQTTPGNYVERLRIEHARELLETTHRSVASIAKVTGFGTVETMHRVFRRRLGTTPGQHRAHFQIVSEAELGARIGSA